MERQKTKAREIAEQIVVEMFRDGLGREADRLALMSKDDRDLGGWGRAPFADQVELIIQEALDGRGSGWIERDRLAHLLRRYDRCRCGWLRQHHEDWERPLACPGFDLVEPADPLQRKGKK